MEQEMLYILGSFLVSMVCGFVLIPLVVTFCKKRGLYDLPNARKVHKCGIPRLGGVCFMPSMVLAFLIMMSVFNGSSGHTGQATFSLWSITFFISISLIYAVGLVDDLVGLSPSVKFAVQLVAASLLPWASLHINNLYGFLGVNELPYWVGAPLTVLVIVFIDNAINLIDGIDGLSSGLSVIALGGFLVFFYAEGLWLYCILIAGLMGVLLAFMYYNLFGRPGHNKIFMGDSGSLTLGFILGFLLVKYSMDSPGIMPYRSDCLLMSCTLLVVPAFDVFRVVLVRLRHHKPIFGADKNHLHHKMMRAGLGQRQALLAILGVVVLFIAVNAMLSGVLAFTWVVLADVAIWLAVQQVVNHFIRRAGNDVYSRA